MLVLLEMLVGEIQTRDLSSIPSQLQDQPYISNNKRTV